jgi:NTE family protein
VDRTVFVDTFGVRSTDFHLDAVTRDKLFGEGQRAAKRFLGDWNFERYLDTYWHPASGTPAPAGDAA